MDNSPKKWVFLKRRDLLFILGLLLLGGLLLYFFWPRLLPAKPVAVVTIGYGEEQAVRRIPLSEDAHIEIDAELPVHLVVEDGGIRFVDSVCPDHLCEGFGILRHEGDWASCLPAGVTLRVEEEIE